jgi:periplasmic protein CpxP/Spy
MKTRTKLVALGTAAVLAGGVVAYAYTASAAGGFGPPFMHGMTGGGPGMMHGGPGMMGQGHGMMGGGHGPLGAALDPSTHLDALKIELAITPSQEAAWTEYTKTVEATATSMHAAFESHRSQDPHAFFAEMHEQRQKTFDTVKAAADTLLASLDDAQKTKAQQILPGLASGHGMTGGTFGPPWMRHGHGG